MTVFDKSPPRKACLVIGLAAVACLALATPASATTYTLADRNSTLLINDVNGWGMFDWYVEGTNQLWYQWFWYRLDPQGPEQRLDTLPLDAAFLTDTNPFDDIREDTLTVRFGTADTFYITIKFSLTGGAIGSYASDVLENINIDNNTGTPLDITFFQYVDFDLSSYAFDDTAAMIDDNTVRQWESQPCTPMLAEVITSPPPDGHEVSTADIETRLNDASPTTLTGQNLSGPPNDVAWAFQWDFVVAGYGTQQISKDKRLELVPEPLTMLGVFLGVGGLCGYIRKRR